MPKEGTSKSKSKSKPEPKPKQPTSGDTSIIVHNVLHYFRTRNPDKSLAWVVGESALALGNFPAVEKVAESIWSYKPEVKQEVEFVPCVTGGVKIVSNVNAGEENASESGCLLEPQIKMEENHEKTQEEDYREMKEEDYGEIQDKDYGEIQDEDYGEPQDNINTHVETINARKEPVKETVQCYNVLEDSFATYYTLNTSNFRIVLKK